MVMVAARPARFCLRSGQLGLREIKDLRKIVDESPALATIDFSDNGKAFVVKPEAHVLVGENIFQALKGYLADQDMSFEYWIVPERQAA